MTKKTEEPGTGLVTEAKAEAAEIKDDIKETKEEAAEARADGDDDRAARLEEKVSGLEGKLDSVVSKIDALIARPFHPAPEERKETEAADGKGKETEAGAESIDTSAADDDAPKPRRRTASRGWFGSRVDGD